MPLKTTLSNALRNQCFEGVAKVINKLSTSYQQVINIHSTGQKARFQKHKVGVKG
jgi:hypothetical protein